MSTRNGGCVGRKRRARGACALYAHTFRWFPRARRSAFHQHSSLVPPAFPGAEPYARAAERGVKIIGATAHYVTEELDEGPIIEQDVARVSHRHSTEELAAIGLIVRDIERIGLARAVGWHLQDRVIVHENRVVF